MAGTANNLSEEKISDKCFELMFAFDEVSEKQNIGIRMRIKMKMGMLTSP